MSGAAWVNEGEERVWKRVRRDKSGDGRGERPRELDVLFTLLDLPREGKFMANSTLLWGTAHPSSSRVVQRPGEHSP